ncbi:hypothetical protein [uncultured Gimesia sp.]|uniref:hypothetical protein n=1 Tax=uncultured Gimesia sp. TaxID=1678688 RepID=UPI00263622EE|nr:hypothetical protein [uncultured Gimesia sp.]
MHLLPPAQDETLLRKAGPANISLFYAVRRFHISRRGGLRLKSTRGHLLPALNPTVADSGAGSGYMAAHPIKTACD